MLAIIKMHWKNLLVVFVLGGTGAVASLLGIDPLAKFTDEKVAEISETVIAPAQ